MSYKFNLIILFIVIVSNLMIKQGTCLECHQCTNCTSSTQATKKTCESNYKCQWIYATFKLDEMVTIWNAECMKENECLDGTTTQEIAGFNVKVSYGCCGNNLCNSYEAAKKVSEQQTPQTTLTTPSSNSAPSSSSSSSASSISTTKGNSSSTNRSSYILILSVLSFFYLFK